LLDFLDGNSSAYQDVAYSSKEDEGAAAARDSVKEVDNIV
jgi:hypothetical protein